MNLFAIVNRKQTKLLIKTVNKQLQIKEYMKYEN